MKPVSGYSPDGAVIHRDHRVALCVGVNGLVSSPSSSMCTIDAIGAPVSMAVELEEGDEIEIQVVGKRAFEINKRPGTRGLLERLRKFRGRLPADFKFDRLEANERS